MGFSSSLFSWNSFNGRLMFGDPSLCFSKVLEFNFRRKPCELIFSPKVVAGMDDEGSSGSRDDQKMIYRLDRHPDGTASNSGQKKRGRKAHGDAIVDAMLEIAAASRMRANAILRNEDRFSIRKCIKLLDEMHGIEQHIYLHALELFENPTAREIFSSLKNDKRLIWLLGKYNASNRC